MKNLLESFKRYIEEAAATNVQDFAVYMTKDGASDINICVYNVEQFIKEMEEDYAVSNSLKGFITIGPSDYVSSDTPCYSTPRKNSWDVKRSSAVEKVGPLLYDIALSVAKMKGSPGLMPDRGSLSAEAENIWKKYYELGTGATGIKVKKFPLDRTPPENETEDTKDDCEYWENRHPAVNHIYSAASKSPYLQDMMVKHNKVVNKLSVKLKAPKDEIEMSLWEAGETMFNNWIRAGFAGIPVYKSK